MSPASKSPIYIHRRITIIVGLALIALLVPLLATMPVSAATNAAATIAIASFNNQNIKGFKLNGTAALSGTELRLNSASTWQAGSAFWTNRVSLANQRSFSTYFITSMSDAGGTPSGADGIVFTIQTQSNSAGSAGGGIGYEGITPSIGIEFDTFQNTFETNDNHVALDVGGDVRTPIAQAAPPSALKNSTWHVWIDYNGATKLLEVRMHPSNDRTLASLVLNVTRDIASDIGQDVYIGFTAATGGSFENHDIKTLYFINDYSPIDTRPPNNYTQAPASVTASPSPASIKTGGSSTITATVKDPAGAVMANQPVTFTTNLGSLVTSSGTTNASGQVSVTLKGGAVAGTATIRATTTGGMFGTTTVTVTAPPVYRVYIPSYRIK